MSNKFDFNKILTTNDERGEFLYNLSIFLRDKGFDDVVILAMVDEGEYDRKSKTGGIGEFVSTQGRYYAQRHLAHNFILRMDAKEQAHVIRKELEQ